MSTERPVEFLKSLILPSGFITLLFVLGLLARFARPLQRFSWTLLATGAVLTLVFSSGKTGSLLMAPLEYEYAGVVDSRSHPDARHIVVLTGWAADDPALPLTDRMNSASAYRVLLALEYWHQQPDLDVIVSGSAGTARIMAAAIMAGGVPADRVRVDEGSPSTADSAEYVKPIVGAEPFFLITSGGHLRRSMVAMHQRGLHPIAAPTDHRSPNELEHAKWAPSPEWLGVSDLAVHEYIGVLWYRFRGASRQNVTQSNSRGTP
jgi:uncharacterized SAM-binding protein YcdF (DUF218 family)